LIEWPALVHFAALFTSRTTDWESVAATALRHRPARRCAPQPDYLVGRLMAHDASNWITYAGLAHASALVGLLATLVLTDLPGVACASTALTAGVITEAVLTLLGVFRRQLGSAAGGSGSRSPRSHRAE
jgi:hypothetical protein